MNSLKLLIVFFTLTLNSQNLVINPSFEITNSNCDKLISTFNKKVEHWSVPNLGTTDIFSKCSNNHVGIPSNYNGFQDAKDGYIYAGCYFYTKDNRNYREYIQGKLRTTLKRKHKYKVTFYVSLADISDYAIKNIDFLLSYDKLDLFNYHPITSKVLNKNANYRHSFYSIANQKFYVDKFNWVKISKTIIAKGFERFITIGNFNNDSKTDKKRTGKKDQKIAYYYIDLVSIEEVDKPFESTAIKHNTNKITKATIQKKATFIEPNKNYIFKNVIFDFNKYDLSIAAKKEIEKVYNNLKKDPNLSIEISGHTDNIGEPLFNKQLSLNRANSVMDYFITLGLSASKIKAFGYGESQPLLPNLTEENRRVNRRVEFKLVLK